MTSLYSSPSLASYKSAVTDQYQPWYPVSTVANLVQALSSVDPNTQAGRAQGLGILTSLVPNAPYAISDGSAERPTDLRFSTTTNAGVVNVSKTYVAGFCDSWPEAFEGARSALGFRDRAGEKQILDNVMKPTIEDSVTPWAVTNSSRNDATQAFRWALNTMKKNLRCGTGVYNYRDFEDKYGLVWGTGPELAPAPKVTCSSDRYLAYLERQANTRLGVSGLSDDEAMEMAAVLQKRRFLAKENEQSKDANRNTYSHHSDDEDLEDPKFLAKMKRFNLKNADKNAKGSE